MRQAVKWAADEDALLIEAVKRFGNEWSRVVEATGLARTTKQCRERYTQHLDPSISKRGWSAEEDTYIVSGSLLPGIHPMDLCGGDRCTRSDPNHHFVPFVSAAAAPQRLA